MKNVKLISIIYLLVIIQFSSCSSVKVFSDKDKTEDFSQFSTFEFYGWADNSDQVLTRFDKERIEAAFAEEAKKRGLIGVKKNGDVIVSLFILGEVKTQKTANTTTTGMGGMNTMGRGHRGMGGPSWGWGATQSHTVINETNYIEGKLMVEMFDVEDKKLIWQALGTKRISEDPKKREKGIPKKVAAIMKTYPITPLK
jgi:uncharacterized protein DUF4136